MQLESVAGRRVVGVQGTPIPLHGKAHVLLGLSSEKFQVDAIVADTPTADVILGRDFLRTQWCLSEMTKDVDTLHVQSRGQSISLTQNLTQLPSSGSMPCCSSRSLCLPTVRWKYYAVCLI